MEETQGTRSARKAEFPWHMEGGVWRKTRAQQAGVGAALRLRLGQGVGVLCEVP
jgi:hypothetical protein